MKQLPLPRKILVLEVPEEADWQNMSIEQRYKVCEPFINEMFSGNWLTKPEKYTILGTWTKSEGFSFDCTPFVEEELKSVGPIYMDYTIPYRTEIDHAGREVIIYADKRPYKFDSPSDSLLSAVHAAGIQTENGTQKLIFIEVI